MLLFSMTQIMIEHIRYKEKPCLIHLSSHSPKHKQRMFQFAKQSEGWFWQKKNGNIDPRPTTVTWYCNTVKICLTIELKRVVNPRAGIKYFICLSLFAVCKWCIVFLNMYNNNTQVCVTAFTTTMGRGDYSRDEFRPVLFKVCRNQQSFALNRLLGLIV